MSDLYARRVIESAYAMCNEIFICGDVCDTGDILIEL